MQNQFCFVPVKGQGVEKKSNRRRSYVVAERLDSCKCIRRIEQSYSRTSDGRVAENGFGKLSFTFRFFHVLVELIRSFSRPKYIVSVQNAMNNLSGLIE